MWTVLPILLASYDYCKNYMIRNMGKIDSEKNFFKVKEKRERRKKRKTEAMLIAVIQSISTVFHNSSARMVFPWSKSLCRMK